jgi:hypothetical protein
MLENGVRAAKALVMRQLVNGDVRSATSIPQVVRTLFEAGQHPAAYSFLRLIAHDNLGVRIAKLLSLVNAKEQMDCSVEEFAEQSNQLILLALNRDEIILTEAVHSRAQNDILDQIESVSKGSSQSRRFLLLCATQLTRSLANHRANQARESKVAVFIIKLLQLQHHKLASWSANESDFLNQLLFQAT